MEPHTNLFLSPTNIKILGMFLAWLNSLHSGLSAHVTYRTFGHLWYIQGVPLRNDLLRCRFDGVPVNGFPQDWSHINP